jgi:hypothetical protein
MATLARIDLDQLLPEFDDSDPDGYRAGCPDKIGVWAR